MACSDDSENYSVFAKQAVVEPDDAKRKLLFQQMNKMIIDDYCSASPIHGAERSHNDKLRFRCGYS
jgi:hypothetical protein